MRFSAQSSLSKLPPESPTTLYAPPSGECEAHVLEAADNLGYDTILWSVDTIDWQKPDAATIIERVESKIHGGAIILAHPTASTVEALPTIIDDLKEEGYNFVTVSSEHPRFVVYFFYWWH